MAVAEVLLLHLKSKLHQRTYISHQHPQDQPAIQLRLQFKSQLKTSSHQSSPMVVTILELLPTAAEPIPTLAVLYQILHGYTHLVRTAFYHKGPVQTPVHTVSVFVARESLRPTISWLRISFGKTVCRGTICKTIVCIQDNKQL
jgi:hypothetical protein